MSSLALNSIYQRWTKAKSSRTLFTLGIIASFVMLTAPAWLPERLGGDMSFTFILTGSMKGELDPGSFVVLRRSSDYQVGDIAGYRLYLEDDRHIIIVHRIVEVLADGRFIFKGDANRGTETVDANKVIGKLALGIPGVAGLARLMRASTLDVMGEDFIRTAKAKGLSNFTVDSRHILKNSMIPIVTVLSFALAGMFTTSFIVEFILGIPGVGKFTIDSVFNRDYPIIMAMTILTSTAFVMANLLADITYAFIDPRIRYQ